MSESPNKRDPDLSPLLPDDATLRARREALVDAVGGESPESRPVPPWRKRGPRLALGGGVALAVAVAMLVLNSGSDSGSQAFAVEPQDGGGVTIKVFSVEDSEGLEGALADAGIESQVSWLPAGVTCREPHFTPSDVKSAMGGTIGGVSGSGPGEALRIGVMTEQQYRERRREYVRGAISADEYFASTGNVSLDPTRFGPDQSVVISGSPSPYDGDPEGGYVFQFGVAEGPVEPCDPVSAPPSGNDPFGHAAPGGGSGYVPRGDASVGEDEIAADLRRAAAAARTGKVGIGAPPASGEFLFQKTVGAHLEAWDPDNPSGEKSRPRYFTDRQLRYESGMPALVPVAKEVWTAADGTTRERETLGRIEFLSEADQERWEAAGSPPPYAFDAADHDVGWDGSGRPVKEYASKNWRGRRAFDYVEKLAEYPTDPEALRLDVENRESGKPSPADTRRGGATVETLLRILGEPVVSPELRAVAFEALAEIPGIGFERGVTDVAGRRGNAIAWSREGGYGQRFIFDPRTSLILAQAEMIYNAEAVEFRGIPDGTVFRETAFLESGIVDSDREGL